MKKLGGVIGGLKFILKYTVYVMAIIKIVQYAITTLDEVDGTEPKIQEANE